MNTTEMLYSRLSTAELQVLLKQVNQRASLACNARAEDYCKQQAKQLREAIAARTPTA